jgi:DNA mismatch repair protein MutH
MVRANALAGRTLAEIAHALGDDRADLPSVRTKGRAGDLIERALGASAGSAAEPDFPSLGIELKTIPVDDRGRVVESTFVCTIPLARIADERWATSWVRRKLSCVLWVPIESDPPFYERRVGRALLWRPSDGDERELAADFDELVGQIGTGGIDSLTAHSGRHLQVRPKAAHGSVRTDAAGPDGELLQVVPRGFYLRASFTSMLLAG